MGSAAAVVLVAMCVLAVTDLRGRTEVHRVDARLAFADHSVRVARGDLADTRSRADEVGTEVSQVATAAIHTQDNIYGTNGQISSTDTGISVDGYDISQLDVCLVGVEQALDQVAVGQTGPGLKSLGSVAAYCTAARPPGG